MPRRNDSVPSLATYVGLIKEKSQVVELSRQGLTDSNRESDPLFDNSLSKGIVSVDNLFLAYKIHPIAFRGVNARAVGVMGRGFRFIHKDQGVVDEHDEWAKRVNFTNSIKHAVRNGYWAGNGFIEIVPSSDSSDIEQLVVLPSSSVRLQRSAGDGSILRNPDGTPKGFEQVISGKGEPIKFTNPIAHIAFNRVDGREEGTSVLQPIYRLLVHDLNIQEGVATAIVRQGFPRYHVKVGDESHPPNNAQVQDISGKLQELNAMNEIVTAYTTSIEVLESTSPRSFDSYNKMYLKQIVAAIGVPDAILLGSGESSNRSVGDVQLKFSNLDFESDRYEMLPAMEFILQKRAEFLGLSDPVEIEWDESFNEDETARVGQVATLFEKFLITREEAREMLGLQAEPSFGDFSPLPKRGVLPSGSEERGQNGVVNPGTLPSREMVVAPDKAPTPGEKSNTRKALFESSIPSNIREKYHLLANRINYR